MILLLTRLDDGNSHFVEDWLRALGKPFLRVNADDNRTKLLYVDVLNNNIVLSQNGKIYDLGKITSVWHRRRGLSSNTILPNSQILKSSIFSELKSYNHTHLKAESDSINQYILSSIKPLKKLGNSSCYNLNKLEVLNMAQLCGLDVPRSFIVTDRESIKTILQKYSSTCITKAMSDGVYLLSKTRNYYSYTEKISLENIENLPEFFMPSLIQLEIKKKYELRVFYIRGEFYSMAIFSQNDSQTSVDFRKYNNKKPNRKVPYLLPLEIQCRLQELFEKLQLDTGSVDLIVDANHNYVFLEINPVGQIMMTSKPCNYYLEKKIAEIL